MVEQKVSKVLCGLRRCGMLGLRGLKEREREEEEGEGKKRVCCGGEDFDLETIEKQRLGHGNEVLPL